VQLHRYLVSFAAITLCVASQRMFIVIVVVVYFVMDSIRKLLDTPSYIRIKQCIYQGSRTSVSL